MAFVAYDFLEAEENSSRNESNDRETGRFEI